MMIPRSACSRQARNDTQIFRRGIFEPMNIGSKMPLYSIEKLVIPNLPARSRSFVSAKAGAVRNLIMTIYLLLDR